MARQSKVGLEETAISFARFVRTIGVARIKIRPSWLAARPLPGRRSVTGCLCRDVVVPPIMQMLGVSRLQSNKSAHYRKKINLMFIFWDMLCLHDCCNNKTRFINNNGTFLSLRIAKEIHGLLKGMIKLS
jgi:hypothetical protein